MDVWPPVDSISAIHYTTVLCLNDVHCFTLYFNILWLDDLLLDGSWSINPSGRSSSHPRIVSLRNLPLLVREEVVIRLVYLQVLLDEVWLDGELVQVRAQSKAET